MNRTSTKTSTAKRPDFELETVLIKEHGGLVCGIDEAGRGPWAGPVVAAAVVLDKSAVPDGLNDSKKLSAQKRDDLFEAIQRDASVGVGIADVDRIDQDNILRATLWAMAEAFSSLPVSVSSVLVDGNKSPPVPCPCQCVVKGDSRSLSIAAASIVAKVTRDRIMKKLASDYPDYGWERNKGYGTAEHSAALKAFGVTPHHRRSFKPVKLAMND